MKPKPLARTTLASILLTLGALTTASAQTPPDPTNGKSLDPATTTTRFYLLQTHLAKATIWQLFPQNERWTTYKWIRLADPAAARIRTAVASSHMSPLAGNYHTLDLEFKDVVQRGACLLIFQFDEGIVGFKRRPTAAKKNTLALIDVTAFDPAQEKITHSSPRDFFAGIEFPQPVDQILPRTPTEKEPPKK